MIDIIETPDNLFIRKVEDELIGDDIVQTRLAMIIAVIGGDNAMYYALDNVRTMDTKSIRHWCTYTHTGIVRSVHMGDVFECNGKYFREPHAVFQAPNSIKLHKWDDNRTPTLDTHLQ
jgi:hypothetical protein